MSEDNKQEEENYENNEDKEIPKEENRGVEEENLLDKNENLKIGQINKEENNENKQQFKDKKINVEKKSKRKAHDHQDEYLDKNNNDQNETINDLFKKALKKKLSNDFKTIELGHERNSMSTKISEVLYNKYIGNNIQKSKHLDIYSKIKDEEIQQGREARRTKQDAKKINNMIVRQEDYEKLKSDKKKGRQKEIKTKLHEECFNPNGKKNISARTPNDFYFDQKKFIEKKEKVINKISQNILDKEAKNVSSAELISKNSEKLANIKYRNESREDFCKRLAEEKLKNIRAVLEAPREEKKMTKQELKDLTDKLYKEGETFKNNRMKKKQEEIQKIKKLEKNDFVLQKSKKVLFDKFISIYENTLNELFNKKDNFQIDYDEYVNILNHLEFIKSNNSNIDNLVKESFNSLKPQEDKIDTYSFLIFALAALGIYKGNNEKVEEHSSKVTLIKGKKKDDTQKQENEIQINTNKNIHNNEKKKNNQIKTSSELIKTYLPNLDLEKYGFTGKECKMIKTKYLPFVSGISESWAKDIFKRKQVRQEESKKNNSEETKKLEKKLKKEGEIIDSFRKKLLKDEFFPQDDKNNKKGKSDINPNNLIKSFKVEDMYEILQKKKQRELDTLKAKQEEDILQKCTFQPNSKTKPVNKKEVAKNIEKLYIEGKNSYIKKKQQEDKDPDFNNENQKNCTFKPAIKEYKGKYFENNPLKEDKLYNMEIKKKEKKKEEADKDVIKQMSFGIEPKSNKDDISKRVIPNRTEKIIENLQNEFIGYSCLEEEDNQTIMKIEINLDNNKKELLVIYPEDDHIKVVSDFCMKHKLSEEKKNKLIDLIKKKY